jgi:beta-lactamase class A
MPLTRRQFVATAAPTLAGLPLAVRTAFAFKVPETVFEIELDRLEAASGGRLGVAVLNSADGSVTGHRLNERFPMCSTFKLLLAGAVLARVDSGRERLDRNIPIAQSDILPYAPITGKRVGASLSVAALSAAAVTLSDNTAANLLLTAVGGPAAVTAFARSLGDQVTRLDRTEPDLNTALPNDPRDTTTPSAMANDLHALMLGKALKPGSRALLSDWLTHCTTGAARLRAGIPADWAEGDKTGTGANNTANDVAILTPPGRPPLFVAVYLTGTHLTPTQSDQTIAAVGRALAR